MPFLMSFVLEPEIVTLAWIGNASVQLPLNIYATKGFICVHLRLPVPFGEGANRCSRGGCGPRRKD